MSATEPPLLTADPALARELLSQVDVNLPGAIDAIAHARDSGAGVSEYKRMAQAFALEFEGGFKRVGSTRFHAAMAKLKKSSGGDKALLAIRSGAEVRYGATGRISWGCANLDFVTSGGAPRGRITQVKGAPSHGKTFACLKLCAEVLRRGGKVCWVALEPFDADWARVCGVPVWFSEENGEPLTPEQAQFNADHPEGEGFAIIVGESGNLVLQATVNATALNVFDVVVVDSIAIAISRTHLENKVVGDPSPGGEAGMINQFVGRVQTALNGVESMVGRAVQKAFVCTTCGESFSTKGAHDKCPKLEKGKPKFEESTEFGEVPRTAVIVVNQLRAKGIGSSMPMAPDASGGFGLMHGVSLDIQFLGATRLQTSDGMMFGIVSQVVVDKSKVGPPKREGVVEMWVADAPNHSVAGHYNLMTDMVGRTIDFGGGNSKTFAGLALKAGLIKQGGAWFYLGDEKFQGQSQLQSFLGDNPMVVQALRAQLGAWIKEKS